MLGVPSTPPGHFGGTAVRRRAGRVTATMTDDEIAALDSAIARIEQAMSDESLPPATRCDLEKVVRTLRAIRDAILRQG